MYLFVKNIPAQKLATQSRRAHFLCRTFLALSSAAPPLLFIDIPPPLFSLTSLYKNAHSIKNPTCNKDQMNAEIIKKRSKLYSFCGTQPLSGSLGAREEDPLSPFIFQSFGTVPCQQTLLNTTNVIRNQT